MRLRLRSLIGIVCVSALPALAQPFGQEFQVTTEPTGYQRYSQAAPIGDTGFVVVWQAGTTQAATYINARRYSLPDTAVGLEFEVVPFTTTTRNAAVASDASGNFTVAFQNNDRT